MNEKSDIARIVELSDKKCGTYYDKRTCRYVCVARINDRYIVVGWYDAMLSEDARKQIDRDIWRKYINSITNNETQ